MSHKVFHFCLSTVVTKRSLLFYLILEALSIGNGIYNQQHESMRKASGFYNITMHIFVHRNNLVEYGTGTVLAIWLLITKCYPLRLLCPQISGACLIICYRYLNATYGTRNKARETSLTHVNQSEASKIETKSRPPSPISASFSLFFASQMLITMPNRIDRCKCENQAYWFYAKVGNVTLKCNGITHYRLCLAARAVTFKSDNG